jgi:hypothetical protein
MQQEWPPWIKLARGDHGKFDCLPRFRLADFFNTICQKETITIP